MSAHESSCRARLPHRRHLQSRSTLLTAGGAAQGRPRYCILWTFPSYKIHFDTLFCCLQVVGLLNPQAKYSEDRHVHLHNTPFEVRLPPYHFSPAGAIGHEVPSVAVLRVEKEVEKERAFRQSVGRTT